MLPKTSICFFKTLWKKYSADLLDKKALLYGVLEISDN
jgi:hypothetical protein